jgi:outer membrane protein
MSRSSRRERGAPRIRGAQLGAALAAILGVAWPSLAHAQPATSVANLERIAVVDVQRVLMETTEGKRELQDIQQAFAKADARLQKKAKAVEQQLRDLQSKSAMLNDAELRKRQEEIMRAQEELQRLAMELQQEVMDKEALATERIYKKVAALVKQVALEESLQVVLVKSEMTVLFTNPKLDLTNRVIVRYDKEHK